MRSYEWSLTATDLLDIRLRNSWYPLISFSTICYERTDDVHRDSDSLVVSSNMEIDPRFKLSGTARRCIFMISLHPCKMMFRIIFVLRDGHLPHTTSSSLAS